MDKNLNTNVKNLYCLGDASGWTRGAYDEQCDGNLYGKATRIIVR